MSKRTKKVKAERGVAYGHHDWFATWVFPRTAEAYDAMVEQMAKAMAVYTWSAATLSVRDYWRRDARRALESIGMTKPKEDLK